MPRTSKQPAIVGQADDRLVALEGKIDALTTAVERVADGLRVLLDVMADIREDLQWGVLNDKFTSAPCPMHITSMPIDPLAPNFGERINRLKPEDLPADTGAPSSRAPLSDAPRQSELF